MMLSCTSTSDENTQVNSVSSIQVDTTNSPRVNTAQKSADRLFKQVFDSLYSKSNSIVSTYELDTLLAEKTDYRDTRTNLFTSNKVIVKEFSFEIKLDKETFRVWILEATYPDLGSISMAFKQIRAESKNPLGLSGGNDFVIKSDNKIYWLMSSLSISLSDHRKMKRFMTKAWNVSSIQDSIKWSRKDN
ncbi:MAG: hypothetical protein ACOYOV_11335 [Bacteroidales bacterium]